MPTSTRIFGDGEHKIQLRHNNHLYALGASTVRCNCEDPEAEISVTAEGLAEVILLGTCKHLKVPSVSGNTIVDAIQLKADEISVGEVSGSAKVRLVGAANIQTIRDSGLVHVAGSAQLEAKRGRGRLIVSMPTD